MKRFAALCLAACMSVAVPAAAVFAEEVTTLESSDVQSSQGEESSVLNIAASLEGVNLPAGAERVTYPYHGVVYESAAKTANGLYLLPVIQEDATVRWYVYNEEADRAIPYVEFSGLDTTYVIVAPNKDVTAPVGYESVYIDVAGQTLPAWFNGRAGDSNMYLIYARDSHGNEGFFRFDGTTGNSIRFVADPDVEAMNKATAYSEEAASLKASYESAESSYSQQIENLNNSSNMQKQSYDKLYAKFKKYSLIALAVAAGAALLILIFFIALLTKSSKLRKAKKKIAELESARRAARTNRSRRSRDQRDPSAHRDTRMMEGREEGTSGVRKVQRQPVNAFQDSTTTSKVTRVAADPQETPKASTRPNPNRPVRPAQAKKPSGSVAKEKADMGETQIFEKPLTEGKQKPRVQELEGLDDLFNEEPKKQTEAQDGRAVIDTASLEKIAERLNTLGMNDEAPVEDDIIDFSKKPETVKPVKPVSNDDSDDEFSLTDFNDI